MSAPVNKTLQQLIDELVQRQKKHVDVYPEAPKPGYTVIPLGGLAKCICSPHCTKELPEPAYRIIGRSEEDKRWNIEQEVVQPILPQMVDVLEAEAKATSKKK